MIGEMGLKYLFACTLAEIYVSVFRPAEILLVNRTVVIQHFGEFKGDFGIFWSVYFNFSPACEILAHVVNVNAFLGLRNAYRLYFPDNLYRLGNRGLQFSAGAFNFLSRSPGPVLAAGVSQPGISIRAS